MGLVIVALVGLVAGDGLFFYWLFTEYTTVGAVLRDHLAVSFMIDAMITLGVLAVHFAKRPPGRYRWPWFVVLSLAGGLCFGLPFYWWMNTRPGARPAAAS